MADIRYMCGIIVIRTISPIMDLRDTRLISGLSNP